MTYAHKIDKSEGLVDWQQSATQLERRVRAFDPFPGACFTWNGQSVKLWRARVCPGTGGPAGQVLASGHTVHCCMDLRTRKPVRVSPELAVHAPKA